MKKNKDFLKLPDKVFGIEGAFLKLFIAPLLVLLGFLISFNLVISPKFSELSEINQSIETIGQKIDLTTQKINYLTSVDQQQIKNDVDFLDSAVLQEKNSYLLVGVVKDVANKHDFTIDSFLISSVDIKDSNTLKVSDKNAVSRLPVEFTLSGPDSERIKLITDLENTLPIIFIESLDVSTNGDTATLELVVSSYYIADEDEFNLNNLSLNDLIPTQEESDLLKTISGFTKIGGVAGLGGTEPFVKYDRQNPFTL